MSLHNGCITNEPCFTPQDELARPENVTIHYHVKIFSELITKLEHFRLKPIYRMERDTHTKTNVLETYSIALTYVLKVWRVWNS